MLPAYARFFSQYLERHWLQVNRTVFKGQLRLPVFQIDESKTRHGFWNRQSRTLGIALQLLLNHSEAEILDVLKHEMAHQYADEVLGAHLDSTETPHGSAFRHATTLLGIQHHARYAARGEASPILRRIQKLLALTQSENPHEAQAAMIKAQSLMARYNVDSGWEHSEFFYRYLGSPVARKSLQLQLISTVLVRFFHVMAIWIPSKLILKDKTVWMLEVSGDQTHLEIAGYVHNFLLRELNDLWRNLRAKDPAIKGQRHKRDFQVGVLKGLIEKLSDQEDHMPSSSKALVHEKQAGLTAFLRERHPGMRSGRRMSYRLSDTYEAGLKQGRKLDIRKGIKRAPKAPKLLKG